MNLKQIQELIKFVAKSGATEVDLEMGDVKICIKSPPKGKITSDISSNFVIPQAPVPQAPVAPAPVAPAPVAPAPVAPAPVAPAPVAHNTNLSHGNDVIASSDTNIENADSSHLVIKSPIIGTFYRKPSPDKDPFVNVGDKIEIGSVVGIVEAMKLFNEIESEISGTIIKVLVDDMSPVEYDQPLFLVDKN